MASRVVYCPNCGAGNQPDRVTCFACRRYLPRPSLNGPAEEPNPIAPFRSPISPPTDFLPERISDEDWSKVNRTKTGLLLLIFGLIISALPIISALGGILSIIGAILVILGRDAFGPKHARNANLSLALYIVGLLVLLVGAASFTSSLTSDLTNHTGSIVNDFNGLFETAIASVVLTGAGTVLLTYALQKSTGKRLLWAGYAGEVVVSIAVVLAISPALASAVNSAATSGSTTPILSLQSQFQLIQLFNIIPAVTFALAYYLARQRIDLGELPEPRQSVTQNHVLQ